MIVKPISVLFPVHKKISFYQFKSSLDSLVYKQSVIPAEILIIFDGPVDSRIVNYTNSLKLSFNSIKIKTLKFFLNRGLGLALKQGMRLAKFDLILRCDSDDFSKKKRIEFLYKYHLKNKNISVIDSAMEETSKINNISRVRFVSNNFKNSLNFFKFRNAINHPTVLMKKKDILTVGNYEDVPYFEDYYLWIKLLKNNFKFSGLDKVLVSTNFSLDFYKRRSGRNYLLHYKNFLFKCLELKFINKIEFRFLYFFRSFIILNDLFLINFFYEKFMRKKN